jgi:chromosome segregation ATPase
MTSLFETLPILEKAVPTVPGKFEEAARDGQAYVQAVRAFLDHIEDKHHNATEMRQQVQNVLEALEQQATEEHGQLDTALTALEHALEEALASIQGDEGEVKAALDTAGTALDELKTDLTEAATRTHTAQEDASGEFEELGKELESDRAELDTAVDGVVAKAGELDTAIGQGRQAVTTAMNGLSEKMRHALDEAKGHLNEAQARIQTQLGQLETQIGQALGDLSAGKTKVLEDLQRQVADDVRQRLDTAVGDMVEAIGTLGTTIEAAQQACQTDREQVEPEVESLRDRFPPLQGAVTQVQQTCREVGAEWPA